MKSKTGAKNPPCHDQKRKVAVSLNTLHARDPHNHTRTPRGYHWLKTVRQVDSIPYRHLGGGGMRLGGWRDGDAGGVMRRLGWEVLGFFGGEELVACDVIDKITCIRGGNAPILGIVA
jgi:ribosome modulation factor